MSADSRGSVDRGSGRSMIALAACVTLALVWRAVPASAQAPTHSAVPISVTFYLGYEFGGPGPDLEDAFSDAGFGDRTPDVCILGSCFNGVDFPKTSRADRPEWTAEVRYRLHRLWSVAALGGLAAGGVTEGWDDGVGSSVIGYRSSWGGLLLSHHLGVLRLGIGPAVQHTEWAIGCCVPPRLDPRVELTTTTRVGVTAEGALPVVRWGIFNLLGVVRYRDTGTEQLVDIHDNTLNTRNRTVFAGLGLAVW